MRSVLALVGLVLSLAACAPATGAGDAGCDPTGCDRACLTTGASAGVCRAGACACVGADAGRDEGTSEAGALDVNALDAGADVRAEASMPADAFAEAALDAQAPACVTGGNAACVDVGCRFAPAILRSCDPGEADLPVYGADFCDRRATLIVIAAGWCPPCMAEAPEIERYITQGYAARGVRVISIVVQKPDRSAADAAFCNVWSNNYSLTSAMAFDPRMATAPYFAGMAFPATVLLDRQGVIRHRVAGTSMGLAPLRAAIDAVLATP